MIQANKSLERLLEMKLISNIKNLFRWIKPLTLATKESYENKNWPQQKYHTKSMSAENKNWTKQLTSGNLAKHQCENSPTCSPHPLFTNPSARKCNA